MLAVVAALVLTVGACSKPATSEKEKSQPPARKAHEFKGTVERVDLAAKNFTVNGENVEGWMPAMQMLYLADPPDILSRIRAGDRISATVYDQDFSTLHDVKIAGPAKD